MGKIKNPVVLIHKRENSDTYAVAITNGSQNYHDAVLMATMEPEMTGDDVDTWSKTGYYMAAEIKRLKQALSAAENNLIDSECRAVELEISRDKCFLSGLKTGWEYGIADETEGYNREIADARAVIERATTLERQSVGHVDGQSPTATPFHGKAETVYPDTLPCAVELKPGFILGKGCKTETLLIALQRRADYYAEIDAMTPEERAENDANIEAFKAMLPQPVLDEQGRNPVLAYADSYRDMAKQGVGSIPVWSVITDLERNIAPLYTTPPAPVVTLTDEQIDAVLDSHGNIAYVIADKRERLRMFAREILRAAMLQGKAEQPQKAQQNIPGNIPESLPLEWVGVDWAEGCKPRNSPVIPDDVLSAVRKVARIRADFDDFDGDRRGIGDCLDEAEQELIVTINEHAAMLQTGNDSTTGKPLTITLPDASSKAFWSGTGKGETFHPENYKRWVKEAIERACVIAGIGVEVK